MDPITEKHIEEPHFLKPYVTSTEGGAVAEIPRQQFCLSSSKLKSLSSRIGFSGFWFAHRRFIYWLEKMETLHASTWRKAGIYEAIKASTYAINKNPSLILSLSEKWCHTTKSFVFPWGEATITLEDVMVLLGFSVLGSSVLAPLESLEMKYSLENLKKEARGVRLKDKDLRLESWVSNFFGRGDQMEHEAFLVMWLSWFVFPGKVRPGISFHVFPIAVRLASGERIALAPAVLANVYKDLSQIKTCATDNSTGKVNLKSLFKLVQVWAWERFKNVRPDAREIQVGQPRIAQWDNVKQTSENGSLRFDDFEWRPYTKPLPNWSPLRLYVEDAMWVTIDDNIDDEFVSFARCVRSSKLVGIGIVEDYYPNRVAMQFGLDQELPGMVLAHSSTFTEKDAWDDYSKSLYGSEIYMPSRLAKASATERYKDWWMKSISKFMDSSKSTETFDASNQVVDGDGGASASTELPASPLFKEELAKRQISSEDLGSIERKRAREDGEGSMDHKADTEDGNITTA